MESKTNLLNFTLPGLTEWFASQGEKAFRARQVFQWIHQRGVDDFDAMTDLAKQLRKMLAAKAEVKAPAILSEHRSADGTVKWLFDVGPALGASRSNGIETVFIPEEDRGTLCVSSQVGCALDCKFCSTGRQGFNRDLSVAEIIGQVWVANKRLRELEAEGFPSRIPSSRPSPQGEKEDLVGGPSPQEEKEDLVGGPSSPSMLAPEGIAREKENFSLSLQGEGRGEGSRPVTNVVMMGMGEPLNNFKPVVDAMSVMLEDFAYGLSRRRVTLSTSGVVPHIRKLKDALPVALAVSLHAPNDEIRSRIMPINDAYPIASLLQACREYLEVAPRDFITFEYVMLKGVNDAPDHAKELVRTLKGTPSKVNLIPFNPFPESGFERTAMDRVKLFQRVLLDAGIIATIRKTRGDDIDAACGQLAGQVVNRMKRKNDNVVRFHERRT